MGYLSILMKSAKHAKINVFNLLLSVDYHILKTVIETTMQDIPA